MKKEEEALSQ
ncbi:BnaAnng36970D [Brassica napus]|uniref:BnaAnng36970D protein n=1 Tax=Brassica napus TaxID=3708 RepID=A0A078K0M2_BRANA|nr:BnaAnng36970D [Brassica napus]